MKILLAGVFDSHYALSGQLRVRALEELGHDVITVDYRKGTPSPVRRFVPVLHRRQALSRVLECLEANEVDTVVVLKGECFDAEAVSRIRQKARVPVVNWFPDDPHQLHVSRVIAPAYDLFFTHDTYALAELSRSGVRHARYLPFACHPAVHHPYPRSVEPNDGRLEGSLLFIGTYDPIRASVLAAIVDLGLTVAGPGWRPEHLRGATVLRTGVYGESMFRAFSRARICLNIHQNFGRSVDLYGHGLNSRVFEVTGCGGVLLTDRKSDLSELFDEDREVSCYQSHGELRDRVEYLLANDDRRRRLAEEGRARAISAHTLHHRFRSMFEEIGRLGSAA
ncbi:MAG: glycosyltransferase [Gemmatimonadaceae bacterium]